MSKDKFDKARWIPFLIVGVILIVVYNTFDNISQITSAIGSFLRVLSPLFIGILLTYFLYRPQRFFEKLLRKVKFKKITFISNGARGISTVIVLLILLVAIALIFIFFIPSLIDSIAQFAADVPGYVQTVMKYLEEWFANSPFDDLNIEELIRDNTAAIINTITSSAIIEQAIGGAIIFAGNFASGVFNTIMGLFLAVYLLIYREQIAEYFMQLNKAVFKNIVRRDRVTKYMRRINSVLFTFIASKSLDALINFVVATTVTLIFGVPYPLLLGLCAGMLNFIPYIGSIISTVIITLLALLTGGLPVAGGVGLCLLIFQQCDGNFIEPRILKSSLKVNPILVIMVVVIGGAYFGLVGMFLAVPISVIIKGILEDYITTHTELESDDSRR